MEEPMEEEAGPRADKRGYQSFRTVFLRTGTVTRAAGSAYAEFGHTKVMVGVYGPRLSDRRESYSDRGRVHVDVTLTPFASKARAQQIERGPELAAGVAAALQPAVLLARYPKLHIDVHCTVLEAGGSELSVLITTAATALADAGIELQDVFAACTVCREGGELLLDPTAEEEAQQDGAVTLALLPSVNQVSGLVLAGQWSGAEAQEALQLALGGCVELAGHVRDALQDSLAEEE